MKADLRKESIIWLLMAIPVAYLLIVWNELPGTVPMHWNWKGETDRWGEREELFGIALLLPLLIYISMICMPKKAVEKMGKKYYQLKFILVFFMSALAILILHSMKSQVLHTPNSIFILVGLLFVVLGNYFQVIRKNYFIGVRLPWTLKNEAVWKKTHEVSGKALILGGFGIIIVSSFIKDTKIIDALIFQFIGLFVIFSAVYSYVLSKQQK